MKNPIIEIKNVGKKYNVTHERGGYVSLRDVLTNIAKKPFSFLKTKTKQVVGLEKKEEFWALKNINLKIQKGEIVGIIGNNGAGKSTLLKVLSQITPPTEGEIIINGRIGSLLEVGTGFHPELTGRENVFLNGAILGMTRKEIAKNFDKIVEFADIQKFIDTPVKYYSSGMYVRLAFSVAAHMEPEILVVDEVLAVGDVEFQKKCLGKMEEVTKKDGRTILFVSHNMTAIQELCQKCVWLKNGNIKGFGDSSEIISAYLNDTSSDADTFNNKENDDYPLAFKKVVIKNVNGEITRKLKPREAFVVEIHHHAKNRIDKPFFWVDIAGPYGHLFGANMLFDDLSPEYIQGDGIISCFFSDITLLPQSYNVTIRAISSNGSDQLASTVINATSFQVVGSAREYGMDGVFAEKYLNHDAPIILPYHWKYENGTVAKPSWQK